MNEYVFILRGKVFSWYNHTCQLRQISTYGYEAAIAGAPPSSGDTFRLVSQVPDCQSSRLFAGSNKSYVWAMMLGGFSANYAASHLTTKNSHKKEISTITQCHKRIGGLHRICTT